DDVDFDGIEPSCQVGVEREAECPDVALSGVDRRHADEVRAGSVDVQLPRDVPDHDPDGGAIDVVAESDGDLQVQAIAGANLERAVTGAGIEAVHVDANRHVVLIARAATAAIFANDR